MSQKLIFQSAVSQWNEESHQGPVQLYNSFEATLVNSKSNKEMGKSLSFFERLIITKRKTCYFFNHNFEYIIFCLV